MSGQFVVLLPVKTPGTGKSRLDAPASKRAELMLAFAADVIAALRQATLVDEVYVVSDDPTLNLDVPLLPDLGQGSLNRALALSTEALAHPRVCALLPDLPAVRAEEIDTALGYVAGPGRWFVADHTGAGTSLLAAYDVHLDPHFGANSAQAHLASGAVPISAALPGLRLDVDTVADLRKAIAMGAGKYTTAVLPRGETPPQR